jgi:hypothetical protein
MWPVAFGSDGMALEGVVVIFTALKVPGNVDREIQCPGTY